MLIKADGQILLSDFGLSKQFECTDGAGETIENGSPTQLEVVGTHDYMAPELARRLLPLYATGQSDGKSTDTADNSSEASLFLRWCAVDWWAFGIVVSGLLDFSCYYLASTELLIVYAVRKVLRVVHQWDFSLCP